MYIRTFLTQCCLTLGILACSSEETPDGPVPTPTDNDRTDIVLTRGESQLVEQSNDFAFHLFQQTASNRSTILSPLSITVALGMLHNGAAGDTQHEILQALGYGNADSDSINAFCLKMLTEAPTKDKLTRVLIADAVYVNKGITLQSAFVETARRFYAAEPQTLDFAAQSSADVVNKWASDHTERMIEHVIDRLDPDAASYLLNAIYFKGAWAQVFDKSKTTEQAFDGGKTWVPMMHQTERFDYSDTDDFQTLTLPYGNGAYRMTVVLPHEGVSLANVLAGLDAGRWADVLRQQSEWEVDVKLPRFETNTDMELNQVMQQLGMVSAFTPQADFSRFCNVPVKVDLIKQVARIKVNEEGTEAAAVTVVSMGVTSAGPSEPRIAQFHATRPFLYVISEVSTGSIFFIGQFTGD